MIGVIDVKLNYSLPELPSHTAHTHFNETHSTYMVDPFYTHYGWVFSLHNKEKWRTDTVRNENCDNGFDWVKDLGILSGSKTMYL